MTAAAVCWCRHAGDRADGPPYVRGKRILEAVLGHLQTTHGMAAATDLIITGGSSGGHATYLNCDRAAGLQKAANGSTRVSCLADAGFFLKHPSISGAATTTPQFEESFYAWNSSGAVNQDCLAHYTALGTPEQCIFAEKVLPFIKTPLFVAQNLYDSWQLNNILKVTTGGCGGYGKDMSKCSPAQMAAVQAYGADMRSLLAAGLKPNHGIFAPSCIAHCQTTENEHPASLWDWPGRWSIGSDNATPMQVFNAWYAATHGLEEQLVVVGASAAPTQLVQQCNWSSTACNTKCPLYT